MKALSLLTVLLCLNSHIVHAQGIVMPPPMPQPFINNQAAQSPAIQTTTATTTQAGLPAPIEIEVPIYEPRAKIQQIYTDIKGSQFFLEVNPLQFSYHNEDKQTNEMANNNTRLTEVEYSRTKFRMLPLDFKFGFENETWGSFAEVYITDGAESSDLTVYGKFNTLKIGGGLSLKTLSKEKTVTSSGTSRKTLDTAETELSLYFYLESLLSDNSNMQVAGRIYIGGGYYSSEDDGLKLSGVIGFVEPGLDVFFKINKNFMMGYGFDVSYGRFAGDVSYSGTQTYPGTGDIFNVKVDFLKAKFLF